MELGFLTHYFPGALWEYRHDGKQFLVLPCMRVCFIVKNDTVCIPMKTGKDFKFPLRMYDTGEQKIICGIVDKVYIDFLLT